MGGLAFNIGNVGGAGLGLNSIFGIQPEIGAIISGVFAILIFLRKEAGLLMDRFAQLMGFVMIALTVYVAFKNRAACGRSHSPHISYRKKLTLLLSSPSLAAPLAAISPSPAHTVY